MRSTIQSRIKKQIRSFWFFCCFAAIFLLGFAVWQMNSCIHASSALSDCQKKTAALASQNNSLELKLSQLNSLNNASDYMKSLEGELQKVDVASIHFVTAGIGRLARR